MDPEVRNGVTSSYKDLFFELPLEYYYTALTTMIYNKNVILLFQLLVSTIDFRYISDVVTPSEAVELLRQNAAGKEKREKELLEVGYPCYTTQVGKIVKPFNVNSIITGRCFYEKRLDWIH